MGVKSVFDESSPDPEFYKSWLSAAAELIRRFIPHRPRHLVLDIIFVEIADLTNIDISPLAILEAASVSIPRIDLYASTHKPISIPRLLVIPITDARLMSALERYTEVVKLINEGKIAIHVEKTALYVFTVRLEVHLTIKVESGIQQCFEDLFDSYLSRMWPATSFFDCP
jgi:hypothetical protein